MARIIVNEGSGPRPAELQSDRVSVGATPDCDVQLGDPGAQGCQFVIERTATGHRVIVLLGQLLLNEEPCDVAHLQHNDTLRVGDSMVLYKNPDARLPEPEPEAEPEPEPAAVPAAADAAIETLEDLPDLEELGELEELEELEADETAEELAELEPLPELEPLAEVAVGSSLPVAPEATRDRAPAAGPLEGSSIERALAELEELLEEPAAPAGPALRAPSRDRASAGDVRFARPLPPGHAAPASPPPEHPGRPPR